MVRKTGTLYIVATPIGNPGDITLRAIETLKQVEAVICEEYKPGSTLLKKLEITGKELVLLNEHNEAEMAADLLPRLLNGESFALISDCGTPVFADPGAYLIQLASSSGVRVSPLPGASTSTSRRAMGDGRWAMAPPPPLSPGLPGGQASCPLTSFCGPAPRAAAAPASTPRRRGRG